MWFLCLTNSEFVDLVAFGSISTIAQVYQTLDDKRVERYAPVFGETTVSMTVLMTVLGNLGVMKDL
jgi:hypothetical protein